MRTIACAQGLSFRPDIAASFDGDGIVYEQSLAPTG